MKLSPMQIALYEAEKAAYLQEVPIGAALVYREKIIAQTGNRTRKNNDPTAHAEICVIRYACKLLKQERLPQCDLYVTLEPCAMCAAAISFARIRRLYYAVADPKGGAVENGIRFFTQKTCHHKPEIYPSIGKLESKKLLQTFSIFFKNQRQSAGGLSNNKFL